MDEAITVARDQEGVDAANSDGSVTVEDGASSRMLCRWVVVRWGDVGLSLHPHGVYGELFVVKIEDGSGGRLLESEKSSTIPSAETSVNLSAVAEKDKIEVDATLMSEKLETSESKDPLNPTHICSDICIRKVECIDHS